MKLNTARNTEQRDQSPLSTRHSYTLIGLIGIRPETPPHTTPGERGAVLSDVRRSVTVSVGPPSPPPPGPSPRNQGGLPPPSAPQRGRLADGSGGRNAASGRGVSRGSAVLTYWGVPRGDICHVSQGDLPTFRPRNCQPLFLDVFPYPSPRTSPPHSPRAPPLRRPHTPTPSRARAARRRAPHAAARFPTGAVPSWG